jgi:hypothetical protein
MTSVFIFCAAAGGTVLVIQFLLSLVGIGGHAFDVDVPHDIGHGFGGDFHGDTGGGFHVDHPGGATGHESDQVGHHDGMWLFKVLSFRAVVAALTFFGLAGLAAQAADASQSITLMVAMASGAAAVTAVYWMMRGLQELRADGTVRVQRAPGHHGVVYLHVPGENSGSGKIQINLQNRTAEYSAVTAGPELPTGTKVVVVRVVNPMTLEVCRDDYEGTTATNG